MRSLVVLGILASAAVAQARPAVVISTPSLFGRQDAARLQAIAAVVEAREPVYVACYTAARAKAPDLTGSLEVALFIAVDGTVKQALVTGFDPGVRACIEAALVKLTFAHQPAPDITVEYHRWAFAESSKPDEHGFVWDGLTRADRQMLIDDRFGTLGYESGTSSSSVIGHAPWVATVSLGEATTRGGALDHAFIRRYLARKKQELRNCYEAQWLANHELGNVAVRATFTITALGSVMPSRTDGLPPVAACVARVIQAIEFPKPTDGEAVEVTFPLTFARLKK